MGEVCLATPAISEGQIFIRTTGHLVAVTDGIAPTRSRRRRDPRRLRFPPSWPPGSCCPSTASKMETCSRTPVFAGKRSPTASPRQTLRSSTTAPRQPRPPPGLDGELALGAARGPLAQMYQPFDRGAVPISLENLGGVRFYARGSHAFELTFGCAGGEFGKELDVSEEWRLVELGADELAPISGPAPLRSIGAAPIAAACTSRAAAPRTSASSGSRSTRSRFTASTPSTPDRISVVRVNGAGRDRECSAHPIGRRRCRQRRRR